MLKILFHRGLSASGGALAVTMGTYLYTTWDIQALPISNSSDPIFQNKHYRKYNPNDNPTVHDLHVMNVPFSQIEPSLLENRERLVERYCGGVWGGFGFTIQRNLLRCFTTTENHLWSKSDLLASRYNPGTTITDEFLVLQKSPDAIIVRGGDKVTNQDLRPLDALIEMTINVKPDEEVVEFGFKSVFFQGIGRNKGLPMPRFVVWLHELYAKALLGSGVRYVLR
ncbi:uncharacterized protein EURHEDRAFT_496721 [Aspergillus ruber CBS 135680]|uniref:Uncharacterized protein n=1 Tax=Aspergillus ruber (strain CBS 135680) TaxID=1388766 RepID=A0A017SIH7_ASPRC|nr:uncharacterized protein EURHEDRAFT_496721 [Aspergillus ruber CBS 135680]EYE96777.1 hypothetical protein EURHEDRAFT_496721 [Aspergillus ruber CBS 135680]